MRTLFRDLWLLVFVSDLLVSVFLHVSFRLFRQHNMMTVKLLRMYGAIGLFSLVFFIVMYARVWTRLPAWAWSVLLLSAAAVRCYGLWQFAIYASGRSINVKKFLQCLIANATKRGRK